MQMKNFQIELSEEVINHFAAEALAKIADGSAVFTSHEEACKVMRDAKDRLKATVAGIAGTASPIQASEYITGMASGFMAISITVRSGDLECVMEFATSEDYKVWKSLNP